MVKSIKVNCDPVEMMIFIWQSISEREKIGDLFFIDLANKKEMKYLYGEDFNEDSVRRVLSAISNRELLNKSSKQERKFWNYNMWILEDLENMKKMVNPIKTLNLDDLKEEFALDGKYEELEIVFIPGHEDEYYIDNNKLIVNFFRIMLDPMDDKKVTIGGKAIKDYIRERLIEVGN